MVESVTLFTLCILRIKSKENMIERPSHNFESNFKNVMYLKHQESRTKGQGNP